ncbi:MAG: prephenate dehydrogenase [Gemmatimonadales bacterium]|nr:MAG: prephenate dehydrogenase [Gemmatimonadales bacterium]
MTTLRTPILIVGLGVMGGSLARALRGHDVELMGIDPDPLIGARALQDGVIDRFDAGGEGMVGDAGSVVYAAPLRVTLGLLEEHAPRIRPDAVVTDVVSLKAPILERARQVGLGDRFVGAHPMCGSERSGFAASSATLYRDARIYLCGDGDGGPVEALWRAVGGVPEWIDPAEHDRMMAWVSHLPQLVANALAGALHAAGFTPEQLGPGARDMTRLAGSNPEMWEDLLRASAPVTGTGLTSVTRALQVVGDLLARRDVDRVVEFMERTRAWRVAEDET